MKLLHVCLCLVQTCGRSVSSWTLLGPAWNFQTLQQAGHALVVMSAAPAGWIVMAKDQEAHAAVLKKLSLV